MAAQIRVVGETDVDSAEGLPASVSGLSAAIPTPAEVSPVAPSPAFPQIHPEVVAAFQKSGQMFQAQEARISAAEKALASIPKAVGTIATLTRALAAKSLAALALLGCLGLAAANAYNPSWQLLSTLGMVIVGVFAPLVWVAYRNG